MNKLDKYILIFSCCIFEHGWGKSLILDLQRNKIYRVPNDLKIIFESKNKKISELLYEYEEDDKETILEYIDFLIKKEIIFLLDTLEELSYFEKINLEWDSPNQITNAIVEISESNDQFLENIVSELENLNCIAIVIIFHKSILINELENFLYFLNETKINNLHILVKYNNSFDDVELVKLREKYLRLSEIVLFSATSTRELNESQCRIKFIQEKMESCFCKPFKDFCINLPFFTESQQHNTCLNRKICIDVEGNIKNCPNMQENYGNIADT
ncbi:MAG: hypothetical protein LBV69_10010, partial [Bacteroidales bacterium]|nr:hypothetical protein [Bacteroidales bacterium]